MAVLSKPEAVLPGPSSFVDPLPCIQQALPAHHSKKNRMQLRLLNRNSLLVVEEPIDLETYLKVKDADKDMVKGFALRYSPNKRWPYIVMFHLVESSQLQVRCRQITLLFVSIGCSLPVIRLCVPQTCFTR